MTFDRLEYTKTDNTWVKRTTDDGIKQELISTNFNGKPTLAIVARCRKTKKFAIRIYTYDWRIVRTPARYYSSMEFAKAAYYRALNEAGYGL